jgi:hypothetical protein
LRLRLKPKRLGIGWRGIVHESYSQRSEIEKEVIAEALDQPRSRESTWLLPGERKGGIRFLGLSIPV